MVEEPSCFASALTADFKFTNDLRTEVELTVRSSAVLEPDLEPPLVSSFALTPSGTLDLTPDFEDVTAAADWSSAGSGVEPDSDDASVAPKPDGDGDEGLVAGCAANVTAEIGIAFTYIGVPRDRMHSMRQQRGASLGCESGGDGCDFSDLQKWDRRHRRKSMSQECRRGKRCRVGPAKSSASVSRLVTAMPALQQVGVIELPLLAA